MATGGQPSDYEYTNESINYARLSRAIIDLCSQVLRDLLSSQIPENNIIQEVTNYGQLKLNLSQQSILKSKKYQNFDISLLYVLIRFLCPRIKPTKGWKQTCPPDQADKSEGDDVERIHIIRNKIFAHAANTSIDDNEFNTHWSVLKDIMTRMEKKFGNKYCESLDILKTDIMDKELVKKYIKMMEESKESEKEMWTEIDKMKDEQQKIVQKQESMEQNQQNIKRKQQHMEQKQQHTEQKQQKMEQKHQNMEQHMQQIQQTMEETIEKRRQRKKTAAETNTLDIIMQHRKSKILVETNAIKAGRRKLDEHGVLIYTGLPGDGKTENAIAIMESYHRDHSDWCFVMYSDICKWSDVRTDIESVIFYDDCLGETNTNTKGIKDGSKIWPKILSSVKEGKIKVIFTVRKSIMTANQTELERYDLFKDEHIVDLTSDEYRLSQEEKMAMIIAHCKSRNIDKCELREDENYRKADQLDKGTPIRISDNTLSEIVKTNPVIGFPFACYLYACKIKYIKQGVDFFNKPLEVLKTDIDTLIKMESTDKEKVQYCIMGYMVLKGGDINIDDLDENLLHQVFQSVGLTCLPQRQIKEVTQELNHRYLVGDDSKFSFKHQTILESVAICFCSDNAPLVLEACSSRFIFEFIRPQNYKTSEGEVVVKLQQKYYKNLVTRFIDELVNDSLSGYLNIPNHPVMDDKYFVDLFIDGIKSYKDNKNLKQILSNPSFFYVACRNSKPNLINWLWSVVNKTKIEKNAILCYMSACFSANTDTLVWLLDHKLGLNKPTEVFKFIRSSTQLAVLMNHPNITLDHLTQRQKSKDYPFSCRFCKYVNNEIIQIIFDRWPDIDLESISNLFICLCCFSVKELVVSIMDRRPDVVTPETANIAFVCACLGGNTDVLDLLASGRLHFITDETLNESFSIACSLDHIKLFNLLIDIANKRVCDTSEQKLNKCLRSNFAFPNQLCNFLHEENHQNDENITNVHIAAFFGSHVVLKKLDDLGLGITDKTTRGYNALMFAMKGFISHDIYIKDQSDFIKRESVVLSKYFSVFFRYTKFLPHRRTSYILNYTEVLIYLINHKDCVLSDLDMILDDYGCTLAHYCVVYNTTSVIDLLCKVRPSLLSIENKNKHKSIDLAVLMGRDEIFKLLYSTNTQSDSNSSDHSTQTQQQNNEFKTLLLRGIQYKRYQYWPPGKIQYENNQIIDFLNFLSTSSSWDGIMHDISFGNEQNYEEIKQIITGH